METREHTTKIAVQSAPAPAVVAKEAIVVGDG